MNIRYILFFLIIISYQLINAQSIRQFTDFGDELYDEGNYYGASIYFKKALDLDSSDINLLYKYANSLKNYNNYALASHYFQKIIEKDKGGRIYKDGYFWLASMQKYNGDYRSSIKTWKKVKSFYKSDKKGYYYKKSIREISSCLYALRSKHDSLENCSIQNLGDSINTTASEFGGRIHDGNFEYSSLKSDSTSENLQIFEPNYKVKIYKVSKDESEETNSPLDSTINDVKYHNANGTYSLDHKRYYFSRCDSISGCKIYVSTIKEDGWSVPIELPSKINENGSNTTHPSISEWNGKEFLFFSSDRSKGFGDMDIWYCEVLDGPSYSRPENPGKNINSPDPEITPFYHSKTNVLYFSSTWHNGFGGFDIFKSSFENSSFGLSENLTSPINTSCNDLYFWLNPSGSKAYLTSNRLGTHFSKGPTCCNDIWMVNFDNVPESDQQIIKTLDDLNKYLPVTLYFHNDRPGPRSLDTIVKLNYLTTYSRYKDLHHTYREEYSKGLSENKAIEAKLDIDDFFKHYVDKGVHDLELFTKLLLVELEKGEKIEVTVKGFASPLAKTNYNVNLAKRRISSMINYLKEYDQGQFIKYLKDGSLIFEKIPFGEYTANKNVSDDYYDQRNSIYNRSAALERRIEIQTIRQANPSDSVFAEIYVEMSTHDFGKLTQGEIATHTFRIKNTGNKDLTILNVESSCGCTVPEFENKIIKPNESTDVTVKFNTNSLLGKQVKSITILADAFPTTKRLVLTAEIFQKEN